MSELKNYSLGRVPQIFGGPDALNQLPALVQASGAHSVAVIADAAVEGNGFLERLRAVLPGIQTFIVAPGEPTCAETNRAAPALNSRSAGAAGWPCSQASASAQWTVRVGPRGAPGRAEGSSVTARA